MIEWTELSHYLTIGMLMAANSIAVGIGEGLASKTALDAMNIQPGARGEISRTMILGSALMETSAILACVMIILLFMNVASQPHSIGTNLAAWGIVAALCLPGIFVGVISAFSVQQACLAVARQPFFASPILQLMLINQSILQTPVIFGFIIAIIIKNQLLFAIDSAQGLRLLGAGISIGLGCIGPIIGLALFAQKACQALGINRTIYNRLLPFSFVSQAIIETPGLFSFVIALLLAFSQTSPGNIPAGIILLAAGLCAGLGTITVGIGSGKTAATACTQMAFFPENTSLITRTSMLAQGIIDTGAIYVFLISLALFLLGQYL